MTNIGSSCLIMAVAILSGISAGVASPQSNQGGVSVTLSLAEGKTVYRAGGHRHSHSFLCLRQYPRQVCPRTAGQRAAAIRGE
jgi:hypothetical protein